MMSDQKFSKESCDKILAPLWKKFVAETKKKGYRVIEGAWYNFVEEDNFETTKEYYSNAPLEGLDLFMVEWWISHTKMVVRV